MCNLIQLKWYLPSTDYALGNVLMSGFLRGTKMDKGRNLITVCMSLNI